MDSVTFNSNIKSIEEQNKMNLGERMKYYENEIDSKMIIKPSESFIVRLDGRSFSKFTRKFVKPFDIVFIKTMCLVMRDLISKFDAQTGYTHSDEITLVFNSKYTEEHEQEHIKSNELKELQNHLFNGRIQKIISLTSSYCSVRFNYHLNNLIKPISSNYPIEFVNLINSCEQMFDARILVFQHTYKHEILNHQIWRSIYDCEKNAISTYAYTYFGPKKIISKSCVEMIQMLKEEKGLVWDVNVPLFIKHGIYCKKNLVSKEINGYKCLRTEYVFKQLKINFSSFNLNMLLNKYWSGNDKVEIDVEAIVENDNEKTNFETTLDLDNLVI